MAAMDNTSPIGPLRLCTTVIAASPITGNKQYPKTEHVRQRSKPVGCSKFSTP